LMLLGARRCDHNSRSTEEESPSENLLIKQLIYLFSLCSIA